MADGLTGQCGTPLADAGSSLGLKERLQAYERRLILKALECTGGNQRRAAHVLGCLPTTLNEKMRRLGLRQRDAAMTGSLPQDAQEEGSNGSY